MVQNSATPHVNTGSTVSRRFSVAPMMDDTDWAASPFKIRVYDLLNLSLYHFRTSQLSLPSPLIPSLEPSRRSRHIQCSKQYRSNTSIPSYAPSSYRDVEREIRNQQPQLFQQGHRFIGTVKERCAQKRSHDVPMSLCANLWICRLISHVCFLGSAIGKR